MWMRWKLKVEKLGGETLRKIETLQTLFAGKEFVHGHPEISLWFVGLLTLFIIKDR